MCAFNKINRELLAIINVKTFMTLTKDWASKWDKNAI
jgi:hypothetical protein